MNFGLKSKDTKKEEIKSLDNMSKEELNDLAFREMVKSTDAIEFFDVDEDPSKMTVAYVDQVRNLPSLMISNENVKAATEASNYINIDWNYLYKTKSAIETINARAVANGMNSEVVDNVVRVLVSFSDLIKIIPDLPYNLANSLYNEFNQKYTSTPFDFILHRDTIFSAYEFDQAKTEKERENIINNSQYKMNELCNVLFQYYVTIISYYVDYIISMDQYTRYNSTGNLPNIIPDDLTSLNIYNSYPIDTTFLYLKQETSRYLTNFFNNVLHKIIENWTMAIYNNHTFVYNDMYKDKLDMAGVEKQKDF